MTKGGISLNRAVFPGFPKLMTLAVFLCLASVANVAAQTPAPRDDEPKQAEPKQAPKGSKPGDAKAPAKPAFTLTVKTSPILNISLKAEKARMSDVARELSKRLKIPVFLGPERQNELVSIEFSELTLEPALQLMSPTVYIDYEIDTGSSGPPKPLGVFFYDANQGEPPLTAVVTGSTESLLIEGDTEDGVEPENEEEKKQAEEEPIRVSYKDNNLTVKAKRQPLPLIVLKIGEELGIPVDIQVDKFVIVDSDISKLPVEDAVRQLSPNIRLFMRADLTRAEKRALRLVLAEPLKATQQNP